MANISANLGFLWLDRPLPERIMAAAAAGFSAVEVHWPYEEEAMKIRGLLAETGLRLVGLNTGRGANGAQDQGVAARPGREMEARELIDQAIEYGAIVGAHYVSVLAGTTDRADGCEQTFRDNLTFACDKASAHGMFVVIEPLSAPGYHVSRVEDGLETIDAVGTSNLGLMLDVFHVHATQGNVMSWIEAALPVLGHVQIASVPDRHEPDHGDLGIHDVIDRLDVLGYDRWIGAEYRPRSTVEAGLGWFGRYREREQA